MVGVVAAAATSQHAFLPCLNRGPPTPYSPSPLTCAPSGSPSAVEKARESAEPDTTTMMAADVGGGSAYVEAAAVPVSSAPPAACTESSVRCSSNSGTGVAYVLVKNPNLTGRTTYWQLALDLWRQHPVIGAGSSGIADSPLYIAGKNAHNLVIDGAVKYGILGAALVVLILGLAGVITVKSGIRGLPLSTGIFAAYLTIGLVEADQGWVGLSLPWLWLVLAVVLAGREAEGIMRNASLNRRREPLAGGTSAEAEESLAREE